MNRPSLFEVVLVVLAGTHVVLVRLMDQMFGLVVGVIDVVRQDPMSNFVSVKETVLKRFNFITSVR